jgi:hypothetical protein
MGKVTILIDTKLGDLYWENKSTSAFPGIIIGENSRIRYNTYIVYGDYPEVTNLHWYVVVTGLMNFY